MRRGCRGAATLMSSTSREQVIPIALAPAEGGGELLSVGAETCRVLIATDGDFVHIHLDGSTYTIRYVDPVQRYGSHAGGSADDIAEAPMPGVVIAVHVKEGQHGRRRRHADGDREHEARDRHQGMARRRRCRRACRRGQAFQRGAPLLSLAPQSGA